MGKKSKTAIATVVANTIEEPLAIDNVEALMDVMLAEYIQVNTVPTGRISGGPSAETLHDGTSQRIHLAALCHFEHGCPLNLTHFIETATGQQSKPARQVGLEWWARTRLRFSCSTLCCSFIKEIVPSLQSAGIEEIPSRLIGKSIRLEDLEIWNIYFLPEARHEVVLHYPAFARTDVVEALAGTPPHCSHNVLCCKKTGIILDLALGQFLGTMQAYVFASKGDFLEKLPGQVLDCGKTMETDILQQYALDNSAPRKLISPDSTPKKFAKRVLSACRSKKDYCWSCKGIAAPGTKLKRCTKCQKATYCGRNCQLLHWTSHKSQCSTA